MQRVLVLLFLACGIVGPATGQRQAVSSSIFFEVTKSTREPLRYPIRSKTTEEIFSSGILTKTIVTDFEGTPAEASRTTITEIEGDHKKASVSIEHGDSIYSKVGSGPWQKERWYFRHPPTEVYSSVLDGSQYWREMRIIDSQNVSIFGSSTYLTLFQKEERFREEEFYFVGGTLVRKVQTDRSVPAKLLIRRTTTTSVHDPKIKVEAPIK